MKGHLISVPVTIVQIWVKIIPVPNLRDQFFLNFYFNSFNTYRYATYPCYTQRAYLRSSRIIRDVMPVILYKTNVIRHGFLYRCKSCILFV